MFTLYIHYPRQKTLYAQNSSFTIDLPEGEDQYKHLKRLLGRYKHEAETDHILI